MAEEEKKGVRQVRRTGQLVGCRFPLFELVTTDWAMNYPMMAMILADFLMISTILADYRPTNC